MKKIDEGDTGVDLEDNEYYYEISWEDGLSVAVRSKETNLYVFDGTFDAMAKRFV